MAGLFQPKRVQVPGLLSDDGLAVALKTLSDTTKMGAEAAPPNTSAVDAANQIATEALKPQATVKAAVPRVPGVELSAGTAQPAANTNKGPGLGLELAGNAINEVGKMISQAGTLSPERQKSEQQIIIDEAKAAEKAVTDTATLRDDIADIIDQGRTGEGLMAGREELAAIRAGQSAEEAGQAAAFVKEATTTAPTQEWWLNLVQVGARSAAQMGVGALRYPADIWDTVSAVASGSDEVKKSEYSRLIDGVDKALTDMLPGDKARSKQFVTKLAAGTGSMVGFMVTGWAGRTLGMSAALTTGVLGAAVEGDSLYQEADTFGAIATQKLIALFAGSALGVTEAVPIDRMFMRADAATGGMIRNLLANTTAGSLEEFIQEASQTLGEDIVAKYGVGFGTGYDPNREIDLGKAMEAGLIGAITGGGTAVATTLLSNGKTVDPVALDEAQITEEVDAALAAEQQNFASIIGDEAADLGGDGQDGMAAAPQGSTAEAAAGGQAAVARPDPVVVDGVRGDAVQQIVEQAVSGKNDPAIASLNRELSALNKRGDVFDLADGELLTYPGSVPNTVQRVTQRTGRRGDLLVDSRYAEVEVLDEGQQYLERRAPKLRADSGLSTEIPAKAKEGVMYRGMSALEYREFLRTGQLVSAGTYNMEGQEGLTYWTTSPEAAVSYSSSFAPAQFKASFERPAYVVAARRTGAEDERAVAGVAEHEVGVGRAVARDEVLDVYEGVVYAQTPNSYSIREAQTYDGPPTVGGSSQGNTYIGWRKLDAPEAALPVVEAQVAQPYEAIQLEPSETLPLPNHEKSTSGPVPLVVKAARAYAAATGMPLRRQREYVKVDVARARRIAQAYTEMKHEPNDPAVIAAYKALAEETTAQYRYVLATGLKIESMKEGQPDPYPEGPGKHVREDLLAGHLWYFPTKFGFGSDATFDPSTNPLLEETEFKNDAGETMLVNDLFRVVHDFFGHGMEGAGFGARGEENAWQAHVRLFSASAIPAMTSETRGQNSWVNYGPFGDANRANPKATVYADQKTGLLPSWTWQEGIEDTAAYGVSAPIETTNAAQFRDALLAAKAASKHGAVVHAYTPAEYAKMRLFLAPDGKAGFALKGDDIVSVFSTGGGRLRSIIDTAIANGGRRLDAFDGFLPKAYASLGFREVWREPWNEQYRPVGWTDEMGKPDVVFMDYVGAEIESMVAAPLFGGNALPVEATGSGGRPRVRDVAQALQDRHLILDGGKLYPEDSAEDYERVLKMGFDDFAAQVGQPNSGIGWYSTDVATAVDLTSRAFPTLATTPAHRDLYLTFAGIFSNGATPEQAWGMSAEAFTQFLETGTVPTSRSKGKWGVRDAANNQQLALVKYTIEREGSLEAAMEWFKGQQKRTAINDIMTESGLYKAGRFTTKAEQQGEAFGFLAFGGKLGRYTLGLHGVELEADNTTVDLWYTRTFRRWTGRLFDAPISAEGVAGGVNSEKERETIFRLTGDIQKQYPGLTAGDVQAVLWFFEKRLYAEHGVRTSEGTNSSGARKLLAARNINVDEGSLGEGAESGTDGSLGFVETRNEIDFMTGTATVRQPYLAEPTRPMLGIPTPSPDPGNQEDVRLSAISRNFITVLGLTARHGRLTTRGSGGEYNRLTAAIRLRTWADLSSLVHEGGHAINDSMAAPLAAFVQRNSGDIINASTMYAGDLSKASQETVRREGFAEFFRVYVTNPAFANNRWPAMVADFEATLKAEDPKILAGLKSVTAQVRVWQNLPSKQLIRNMIVDGKRESGVNTAIKEMKDNGFKTWMTELFRRKITQPFINRYVSVAELEAQLLNLGERNRGASLDVARGDLASTILRLGRNSGSRAQVQITDGIIGYRSVQSSSRGLREALMTALGIPPDTTPGSLDEELMKDFDAYLLSRRAFDEYRRFDLGEIERPPIGAQKGDVMRAIKEYEKTQPQFVPAAAIVHEYGMAMWQKRYDAGLMDKETYEEGLQRQFYAPLQRDVSDKQGTGADSIGFGSSVLTKGPRFRGSDRDIISPMTMLMQMTLALEKQISENDAKRALAVLADRAGQAGALVERIPASQLIGQSFSVRQVAQRLTADDGLTAEDAADLMTILAGSIEKGDLMTLFRSEQAGTQGENVIFFWENGKIAAIRLNNTDLATDVVNTMNAIGRENMEAWAELIAGTSTVFRTAITSWPDYLLVNYIRDQFQAFIYGDSYIPFATGFQGISDEIRQKQWAKSYNAAGGILGGMNVAALHTARVDRDLNALRAKGYVASVFGEMNGGWSNVPGAIKGLARFTALTETGTRLGLYRGSYNRAIKDGLSEYDASVEAAYIATDYMDFGLNGSKMLHARRLVPFLNAQLQGLYKLVRTLGGDEVARRKGLTFALGAYFKNVNSLPLSRLEQQQLRTGRAAWLKMASLGFIGAALWAIFKDDPDYQEAGEYLRTTGWVIPIGDGKIFYIPKPFELAVMSNAVERGLEYATGDSAAMDRFVRGLGLTMIPPTTPPAIQTAYEVMANYDFFTGREIVPNYMQALAPQLQYDNYTSSIAKWLGGVTGQSPLVVDHILSGMGASAYRDISTMLNAADPSRPLPDDTDLPILRRFVRDVRRGSASAQDFWAQASNTSGRLERAKATYKRYQDGGNQPAANRFLSTLSADERAYAILMTDFKVEEKRLNPFYRARQLTTIVSDMRRQNSGEGLEDTTMTGDMSPAEIKSLLAAGGELDRFAFSRGIRTQVDDILSEIARREVRNTMIATGQPGWAGKEVLDLRPTLDMLLAVSPDTYDEFERRRVKAKVYGAEAVYEYWPEVRDRLVGDGPDAILSDAVAVAGVVF